LIQINLWEPFAWKIAFVPSNKVSGSAAAPTSAEHLHAYDVWDAPTPWFHWINALEVLGLIIVGVILLNDDALGLAANGKARKESGAPARISTVRLNAS
jgi:hypothetical protein